MGGNKMERHQPLKSPRAASDQSHPPSQNIKHVLEPPAYQHHQHNAPGGMTPPSQPHHPITARRRDPHQTFTRSGSSQESTTMTLGSGLGRWTVPLLRLSFLPSGPLPAADPGIQHHQQHQNGRWSGPLTGEFHQ
ncbi:hypothetical protein DPEC_G00096460 [Dallia pectoralis]|uniref:Uncharacterized protein n=1 Tax=Dallia pectoralis TaxID=75939 RepID=A0ACC2GVG5_DALPE|nr:hypothetical protein DPEC_G00096460 [Dallia pectoralis]